MEANQVERLPVSTLRFDPKNPRLPEFELTDDSTESEIIQVLWDAMDVRELVLSIAASGFFSHEPLIVDRENGKNVVIEGNRRLAAVRILLTPEEFEFTTAEVIPEITTQEKQELSDLPVVIGTRGDVTSSVCDPIPGKSLIRFLMNGETSLARSSCGCTAARSKSGLPS